MILAIFGVPALLLVALIVIVVFGSLRKKKIIPPFEDPKDWGRH